MVKKLVVLGMALALLALLESAAVGVKFTDEDLKSEESLWRLYERWGMRYNMTRHPVDKLRRFSFFKDLVRHVHLHATAAGQTPGLNGFTTLPTASSTATTSATSWRSALTHSAHEEARRQVPHSPHLH
uniref:Cathepsin propeptide inhibitor domain-containing protein n=1 Tax=Leersia perrieri TaxID=77586 RepID=A0A0D9VND3_9ORYZ